MELSLCRGSHLRCSVKNGILRNFSKFTGKHVCQSLFFLVKLQAEACNFIKGETLALMFYFEFFEISKNTFFIEHLRATASVCEYTKNASSFERCKCLIRKLRPCRAWGLLWITNWSNHRSVWTANILLAM